MLPQSRTLEVSAADKLRGMYETGRDIQPYANIAEGRLIATASLSALLRPVRAPEREERSSDGFCIR